jgi:hypothetical protein
VPKPDDFGTPGDLHSRPNLGALPPLVLRCSSGLSRRPTRLAKLIDSDIRKDKHLLLTEIEVVGLRRQGAIELHSICADFVASVNRKLSPPVLELSPPEYAAEMFRESCVNLTIKIGGTAMLNGNGFFHASTSGENDRPGAIDR